MKTTTIKKSALALMACILALAFALVGCGGSKADPEEAFLGSWKLSGGEIYGEELDEDHRDHGRVGPQLHPDPR